MNSTAKIATAAAAAMIAISVWKGRDIRAYMTMTGDGWNKMHPEVKVRAAKVLEKANKAFAGTGLTVGIFEGWRSVNTQQAHMASGASFVDSALNSYHPWGLAADFVFLTGPGLWTWDPDNLGDGADQRLSESWQKLGAIIKSEGFEWGGDWQKFDGPHGQLPLMRTAALRDKYTAPEAYITWA